MRSTLIFIFLNFFIIPVTFGQTTQKSYKLTDKTRVTYSVYHPENYKKVDSLSLVIALHWGWGQRELPDNFSQEFMENFVIPIYKNQNKIIIAPNCPVKSWVDDKSIASVLELRDYCIEKYNIDTNKIIITGFSLGGIGTWYLATHYSNLFTCAIPIAGYPEMDWLKKQGEINLLVVNSVDDEIIPFEKVNSAVEYIKSRGQNVRLKKLFGVGHYSMNQFIGPVKDFLRINNDFLVNLND